MSLWPWVVVVGCVGGGLWVVVLSSYIEEREKERKRDKETKNKVRIKNNNKERIFK